MDTDYNRLSMEARIQEVQILKKRKKKLNVCGMVFLLCCVFITVLSLLTSTTLVSVLFIVIAGITLFLSFVIINKLYRIDKKLDDLGQ